MQTMQGDKQKFKYVKEYEHNDSCVICTTVVRLANEQGSFER